jgi:prepilin-type N-terminal cleavage/methylation domain-containing protein
MYIHINKNVRVQAGFTLVELIIVLSIIALLAGIMMPSLSGFHNEQALRNTTEDVLSLLNQARSDTLGSLNATNYSVAIGSDRVTYFAGSTFSNSDPSNQVVMLDSSVTVAPSIGISLNGGGSTVTFDRLTGDTSTYGTIILELIADPTQQKTITVSKTGLISSN